MKRRIDPRSKNEIYSLNSISEFLGEYADRAHTALTGVSPKSLEAGLRILRNAKKNGHHVYAMGNGGSSAIADHLCCDWTKGTDRPGRPSFRTHSATSNAAFFTALANDYSYEDALAIYLKMMADPSDVAVFVSSSGNSENIVRAAKTAKSLRMKTIGLTGFSGGKLGRLVDVHLHIPVANYGIVEDCHQSLMHVFAQYLDATPLK